MRNPLTKCKFSPKCYFHVLLTQILCRDGIEIPDDFLLEDGETLKLPPTPEMLSHEEPGFRESWLASEQREKARIPDVIYDTEEERIFARRPPPKRTTGNATPPSESTSSLISAGLIPSLPPRRFDHTSPIPTLPPRQSASSEISPPAYDEDQTPKLPSNGFIEVKRPEPEHQDSELSIQSINTDASSVYSVDTTDASSSVQQNHEPASEAINREQEEHDSEMISRLTLSHDPQSDGSAPDQVQDASALQAQHPGAAAPVLPPRRRPVSGGSPELV